MKPNPERIKEIFSQALEKKSPAERESYLAEACQGEPELRQQVESLVQAHEQAGKFLGQTMKLPPSNILAERAGTMIGRYKLLELIGEGGFGVVWMAEQEEPVRRRVALKVIKPGMDTKQVLARFEAERQALAMMDHPSIARVFDGGATDTGRPYFVMELVRGERITDYCDGNKLSMRERLALFIQVCQAVQHAHQKGIIHRDLKPSNILVTEVDGAPVPKVIDFGVAKATQARLTELTLFTGLHQMIGTPSYMSPEQAGLGALDMDTRSDIYALGVLLYELLTGQTPLTKEEFEKAGLDEVFRLIREQDPPKPSNRLSALTHEQLTTIAARRQTEPIKLNRLLAGDLDWIVMKCLEKDRRRRYETANGLVSDLQRHVNNEPVVARPPSNVYRFQKMVRRNKLVFAAGCAVAAALVLGFAISAWQASRARQAEKKALAQAERATRAEILAEQRLTESETISKFLTEVFRSPDPNREGRAVAVTETLSAAARKLETDLASQPGRRAEVQDMMAQTYNALGLYREAIPLQEKVRDYYLSVSGLERPETLAAMNNLAISYDLAGRWDEAIKLEEEVMALRRKVNGLEHPDTLASMQVLANCYGDAGHRDEAINLQEKALALSRKVVGSEHPDTLRAISDMAISYYEAGRLEEALKLQEELLALSRKVSGMEKPDNLVAMHDLARYYCSVGRNGEGIAVLAKSSELDPKDTDASEALATWQVWFGKDADYEATRRRLVQQADHTEMAPTAERAAKAYCLRPSTDAALLTKTLKLAQRAVELRKSSPLLPWYQLTLGVAEYRNGQYATAERTLAVAEQSTGEYQATARFFRAMSLCQQDRQQEARKLFSQAEAQMPPLPTDRNKPLVDGRLAYHTVMICWLAYKEAKSLLNAPAAKP